MDARRGPIPCHSLQNDGDDDASGLRLQGQSEALEDGRNGKIDPDWSQELHRDIDVQKGDSVQPHNSIGKKWYGHGDFGGASQLWLEGPVPQQGKLRYVQKGLHEDDREEDHGLGTCSHREPRQENYCEGKE